MDDTSIYPELLDPDGRAPWALLIEPYVCRYTPLVGPRPRMAVLRVSAQVLITDMRCRQFGHRLQWGEYLVAQDPQENPQRPRTSPEPETAYARPIKAARRAKR